MVGPAVQRDAVAHLRAVMGLSERRACSIVGADRKMVRYRSRRPPDTELRARLHDLANERRRFGYRRLFILLRREGEPSGVNRIHRLYREEGLSVRKRRARRKTVGTRAPILVKAKPNARWSTDFVHDQFANGRRFRILNIVDDVTKQCLGAIPDTSISGRRVARELTALIERHGKPGMIVSDHGTEYTCNTMLAWCRDNDVNWHFIAPRKPMQNGLWRASMGACATSFSMRRCSSISTTHAPRSRPGSSTSIPRVRTRRSDTSRRRPTPPTSPQRTIG
jgi:putative transposase